MNSNRDHVAMRHVPLIGCLVLALAVLGWGPHRPTRADGPSAKESEAAAGPHGTNAHIDSEKKTKGAFLRQLAEQAIWTIVVFLVLLLVLSKVAWKPLLEGLQRREATIRAALDEAQKAREETRELRGRYDAEMKKAAENARDIIEEARRDATRMMEEERARGKAEIQTERDRLFRELTMAKDQAIQEMWQQAAQLATLISSKAIRRQINADDHRALLDEALNEMRGAVEDREAFMSGKA